MVQEDLQNRYFEWMYQITCGGNIYRHLTYRKLLMFLHNVEFTYILRLDANRAQDGISFRYRFGYEDGYDSSYIERYLDVRNCSVLEMMVALAFRVEEQIMDDDEYGNRTSQWFWNMIVSLGLGGMDDSNFDEDLAAEIIFRFLNRDYEPSGRGGLFTLENYNSDVRELDIWSQCMWHLDEIIAI